MNCLYERFPYVSFSEGSQKSVAADRVCLIDVSPNRVNRSCKGIVEKPVVHWKKRVGRKARNKTYPINGNRSLEAGFRATVNRCINLVAQTLSHFNDAAFHAPEVQVRRLRVENS